MTRRTTYSCLVFIVDTSGSMAEDGKIDTINRILSSLAFQATFEPSFEWSLPVLVFASKQDEEAALFRYDSLSRIACGEFNAGGTIRWDEWIDKIEGRLKAELSEGSTPRGGIAAVLLSDGWFPLYAWDELRRRWQTELAEHADFFAVPIGADSDRSKLRLFTGTNDNLFSPGEIFRMFDFLRET